MALLKPAQFGSQNALSHGPSGADGNLGLGPQNAGTQNFQLPGHYELRTRGQPAGQVAAGLRSATSTARQPADHFRRRLARLLGTVTTMGGPAWCANAAAL